MSSKPTDKKTIVITGGSSGIGLATAKILLKNEQFKVVILGKNKAKLEEAAHSLQANHHSLATMSLDLANLGEIENAIDKIAGAHNGVYGLVNNAGIYPFGGLSDTTLQSWDQALDINLKAPFLLCKASSRHMIKAKSGGRIVNVSSTAGLLPNHFALAYSVSKAALIQLSKTLAKELGKHQITVNCICPGIVKSPLHEAYHQTASELESFYAKRGASFPLGRVGEPDDIAGPISFMLSEEAGWMTGDVAIIDGGRLLI